MMSTRAFPFSLLFAPLVHRYLMVSIVQTIPILNDTQARGKKCHCLFGKMTK